MKKTILLSGVLMFLFSCGKNEKVPNEAEIQNQELFSQTEKDFGQKQLKKLIFKNLDEIEDSKEMNLQLLSKSGVKSQSEIFRY